MVSGNVQDELLTRTDQERQTSTTASDHPPDNKPRRINVAVTPDAIRAIERVIERENVTLTEAVRRLLKYGYFVYQAVKEQGGELELQTADGTRKEVVFV